MAFNINYSTSSGKKTTSAVVSSNPGAFTGIDLLPPDMGEADLIIWDSNNTSTAGKNIIAEIHCDAGMPTCNHEYFVPVIVNQGIYAELTLVGGTTAGYIVRYFIG